MIKNVNPRLYIIVNKALKMNPGKVSIQIAHAISGMFSKLDKRKSKNGVRLIQGL